MMHVDTAKLRKLADFLDTLPDDRFTLSNWGYSKVVYGPRFTLGSLRIGKKPIGCGFVGCAMGWAAHEGLFEGLEFDISGLVTYGGEGGFSAAMKLFGISQRTAVHLFAQSSYRYWYYKQITPAMVTSRMRRFADKIDARVKRVRIRAQVEQIKTDALMAIQPVEITPTILPNERR